MGEDAPVQDFSKEAIEIVKPLAPPILSMPVYKLLGRTVKDAITPYASLLPPGTTLAAYQQSLIEKVRQAQGRGFRAGKLQVCINGPYSHNSLQEPDDAVVDIVAACREAIEPDFVLMVDVAYDWSDAKRALCVLKCLEPYDLFFHGQPKMQLQARAIVSP